MMPTAEAATVLEQMAVDLAVSEQVFTQRYGLDPRGALPRGLRLVEALIAPHRGVRPVRSGFVVFSKNRYNKNQLRHMAGTALFRFTLNARHSDWEVIAYTSGSVLLPDAYWRRDKLRIAVEYDVGGYSPTQVQMKYKHFNERFDAQLWATTHVLRQERLKVALVAAKGIAVVVLPWWGDTATDRF